MNLPIVSIEQLTHRYPGRPAPALDGLSLWVQPGEIFGFLGPNGSGKSTLFRILSTLIPPQQGKVTFNIPDASPLILPMDRDQLRSHIAVVFQSPSLDKQLTAAENLRHHGHLYGLRGSHLESLIDEMLRLVALHDRPRRERVEQFSGGMRRRVELAKALLTRPRLLLMDEPSTGLDPGARIDLWRHLREFRQSQGVTILLTTHLMEEADHCDRLAILDRGRLAACDTPDALKARIGADVITIQTDDPQTLAASIRERFAVEVEQVDSTLRIERARGHEFIPQLVEAFVGRIRSVSLGKPTLEDVFIHVTGRAFRDAP